MEEVYSRRFLIETDNELRGNLNDIHDIMKNLKDEESVFYFLNRLMYSITLDYKYIRIILDKNIESLRVPQNVEVYIYGAGIVGTRLPYIYPDINWKGYIDQHKTGKLHDLDIVSLSAFFEHCDENNSYIVVSNLNGFEEIRKAIMKYNFPESSILCIGDIDKRITQNMYFDNDIFENINSGEGVFVDVGAFDGLDSIKLLDGKYSDKKSVVVIEPDPENYKKCCETLKNRESVEVINKGVSNKTGKVKFNSCNSVNSQISDNGNMEIEVERLDNLLRDKKVWMLKMDIEGVEREAIEGAKTIIERDKPILAISVYHRRNDIWEIPKLLLAINKNYRFYIRHYRCGISDTVLYAVDKEELVEG